LGNKIFARNAAKALGISVIPGSEKVSNSQDAMAFAGDGTPVLLKAAAGGGGRGMRVVLNPDELKSAFEAASAEALAAFGDGTIYIERFISNARHIEVQVMADNFGNVIHLGERDCSIQRRFQKVIEEAPAPTLTAELREKIRQAGVTVTKNIGYTNAGTVEFILDQDTNQFYFLEMNTRIQVEHPITEMISGMDLVQEQIRVAAGNPLSIAQSEVKLVGHSIECRVNAESPNKGFKPCPGRLTRWVPSESPGIRVDTHCYEGYFIQPFYDSLIAKLIATGKDRSEAIVKMQKALEDFQVAGVETTIPFLREVLSQTDYLEGKVNVSWLENYANNSLRSSDEKRA
jgi:acetyl-CoA carboxylase biotin carboxylase subunit